MTKYYLTRMRNILPIAASLLLAVTGTARAVVIEGFEAGTGTVSGNAITNTVYGPFLPTELTHQLLLSTASGTSTVASLESFLSLPAGTIRNTGANRNAVNGSAFERTNLTLSVGDVVSFNYVFMTSEGSNPDFAFFSLLNTSTGLLANYNSFSTITNATFLSSTPGFSFDTGAYGTFSFTVTTAGIYTLGIGVANALPNTITAPSGLLVDNLQVNAIPEPSTLALAGLGAFGLAAVIRRRRMA